MILSNSNLHTITTAKTPHYNRSKLTPGIVHIGLGNFHRAHQAWYIHRLMQQGIAYDWAIIGAGILPGDALMRAKLKTQDYLTTLIQLDPNNRSAEIIGSIIDYIPVEYGNRSLIQQLSDPCIRIVSLTITEGGYFTEPLTSRFDASHRDIQHDADNPQQPSTVFGAIVAALQIRHNQGIPPFTCLSCDNLQTNGNICRQAVTGLAQMTNTHLADWIHDTCSFPNSMVDSIVTATGEETLALVRSLGIEDAAPVAHEPFRQWVVEDRFCTGRPQWEKAGVTVTDNVHDYETMKIRILNGGHQILAAAGDLLSIRTIAATMEHDLITALFYQTMKQEILPHVQSVPAYSKHEYLQLITQRFRNPAIQDTTRRVAFDGLSRQSGFIVPSIRDCLKKGIVPNGLALVSAIWCRYCLAIREDQTTIEPNGPHWHKLQQLAQQAQYNPKVWLDKVAVYGQTGRHPQFRKLFIRWLSMLHKHGLETSLKHYNCSLENATLL